MFGKTVNVVIFVVLCFAYTAAQDYYDGYEDGAPVPGKTAVSKEMMQKMATNFLRDDRFEDKINHVREKALDKERECRSKNYSYWDAGIPECRNCLEMDRCQENEACSRECRDILKILHLESAVAENEQKLEEHERKIALMQNTIESLWKWNIGLTVALVVLYVGSAAVGMFTAIYRWAKNLPGDPTQVDEVGQDARQERGQETIWQKAFRHIFSRRNVNTGSEDIPLSSRTEDPPAERTFQDQGQALLNGNATPA